MPIHELAPELVHHLYNNLSSISDVIHLSSTCRRLYSLLPPSQKLFTLFRAAEQEFGPLQDVAQLLTHNASQPVHLRRHPQQSYALLKQIIQVGRVARQVEQVYQEKRWEEDFINRRSLTVRERVRVRRAVYKYWLYCEAFHNKAWTRSHRMVPHLVEERAQLLRTWTTDELVEVEDLRMVLEDLVTTELCPTDSMAAQHNCSIQDQLHDRFTTKTKSWNSWPSDRYTIGHVMMSLFHSHDEDLNKLYLDTPFLDTADHKLGSYANVLSSRRDSDTQDNHRAQLVSQSFHAEQPVQELRRAHMVGWGDQISQYYIVQSMLKLNPAQIMDLYNTVLTRSQLEVYIASVFGLGSEEWFWNNGQTWLDTWNLVLSQRGENAGGWRDRLLDGKAGIAADDIQAG